MQQPPFSQANMEASAARGPSRASDRGAIVCPHCDAFLGHTSGTEDLGCRAAYQCRECDRYLLASVDGTLVVTLAADTGEWAAFVVGLEIIGRLDRATREAEAAFGLRPAGEQTGAMYSVNWSCYLGHDDGTFDVTRVDGAVCHKCEARDISFVNNEVYRCNTCEALWIDAPGPSLRLLN